jgi:hypothetical protein
VDGAHLVECARTEHPLVPLRFHLPAKEHVLPQRAVHDPGLLRAEREGAPHGYGGAVRLVHLAQEGRRQRALAAAHRAHDGHQLTPERHRNSRAFQGVFKEEKGQASLRSFENQTRDQ